VAPLVVALVVALLVMKGVVVLDQALYSGAL